MDFFDLVVGFVSAHDGAWGNSNTFNNHNMLHSGLALCEEAGEVGGYIKKWDRTYERANAGLNGVQGKSVDNERMVNGVLEEISDVLIYVAKLWLMIDDYYRRSGYRANMRELVEQVWREKFAVLHTRFDSEVQRAQNCVVCDRSHGREVIDDAIDAYLAGLRRRMEERVKGPGAEYQGAWLNKSVAELRTMRDEEIDDMHVYSAMMLHQYNRGGSDEYDARR